MLFRLLNVLRADIVGKLMTMLVQASSRNRTLGERVARIIVSRVFAVPRENDFMADEFVDNDMGYDLAELRRYQRGL